MSAELSMKKLYVTSVPDLQGGMTTATQAFKGSFGPSLLGSC